MRDKFLYCIRNTTVPNSPEKIFISRKNAPARNIINEDEIFHLFEQKGFIKYTLETLSTLEQITLFHNAKIIVAAHGAALINTLFCKPSTHIIEIFQERSDCCFYYLSQRMELNHHCIQTIDFQELEGYASTTIPLFIIQDFINNNSALFDERA